MRLYMSLFKRESALVSWRACRRRGRKIWSVWIEWLIGAAQLAGNWIVKVRAISIERGRQSRSEAGEGITFHPFNGTSGLVIRGWRPLIFFLVLTVNLLTFFVCVRTANAQIRTTFANVLFDNPPILLLKNYCFATTFMDFRWQFHCWRFAVASVCLCLSKQLTPLIRTTNYDLYTPLLGIWIIFVKICHDSDAYNWQHNNFKKCLN